MQFTCSIGDIDVTILAEPALDYLPDSRFNILDKADLSDIKDGSAGFYSVTITSKVEKEEAVHFWDGHLFSHNAEDMEAELEELLDSGGLMLKVSLYWKVRLLEDGPSWKLV